MQVVQLEKATLAILVELASAVVYSRYLNERELAVAVGALERADGLINSLPDGETTARPPKPIDLPSEFRS